MLCTLLWISHLSGLIRNAGYILSRKEHYQHDFNENPMKCLEKAHESFFLVINFAIVIFMGLVQGHNWYRFSMNYRTVFYTTHGKRFSWPWKFLSPKSSISWVIKYVSWSIQFINIPNWIFMGHEILMKSLQTSVIPSHSRRKKLKTSNFWEFLTMA